jgi:hypothetical protein
MNVGRHHASDGMGEALGFGGDGTVGEALIWRQDSMVGEASGWGGDGLHRPVDLWRTQPIHQPWCKVGWEERSRVGEAS